MKKKIGLLLFIVIISFCFINVEAKTVWKVFLVGCSESEEAYFKYFGKKLTKSGRYAVEIDEKTGDIISGDITGKFEDISSTEGCGPSTSGGMACSFGCLESAVNNANNPYTVGNTTDLFNAFGGAGNSVNSYCKEVCFDKKKFIAPENNSVTVKQGTRFNWLNSEGHILTLKDDRTCMTFFDSNSWQNAYNSASSTVRSTTDALNRRSYSVGCDYGYVQRNDQCIKYRTRTDGKRVEVDRYTLSCSSGYYYDNNYCYMTSDRRNELIDQRNGAINKINSLIGDANSCYNHKSSPINGCDDVKISYGDEVYGSILESDSNASKLNKTGSSNVVSDTRNATNKVIYNYSCSNSYPYSCTAIYNSVPVLKYRKMQFHTEYNWDLQDDIFSCVDISGYSHLRCEYAEKYSGTSGYFGKYQNYIKLGSNLPVNFNSEAGQHEISIDYGCEDAINSTCSYNVSECPDGVCVPKDCDPTVEDCDDGTGDDSSGDGGGSNNGNGIDVIYRVIDLNNPFPNRTPGYNWNMTGLVDKYITNNRKVKTEEVYTKEPMYTIELDPALIKEIRNSNKDVNYGDLNLYCTDGVKCRSSYLRELRDNGRLSGCGTLDDFDACEVGG